MPKWSQNLSKNHQNCCQKSMRKSMQKSMQNGTLKRRVGGKGVSPLSSTQSLYLVTCFLDSYINHQRNPQNCPSAPLRGCAAGSMGYRLFRRPQISFVCVIVFVSLGLCDCGIVGMWVCGLSLFCEFVCNPCAKRDLLPFIFTVSYALNKLVCAVGHWPCP